MAKIGIDFGTTYTTVSWINPNSGKAEPIRIDGEIKIPTCVYFPPEEWDDVIVGVSANAMYENCRKMDSQEEIHETLSRLFTGLKRDMRPNATLYLPNGEELTYAEIISKIFSYIKNEVEQTCTSQEEISEVVLTHPVVFEEFKKKILIEAATIAGFKTIRLLTEPVAAAMGYMDSSQYYDKGVLIYDFGGGTFDLAYVKFDSKGDYNIALTPIGDDNCGGDNIDAILYDTWDKFALEKYHRHICSIEGGIDVPFLKTECERHKRLMSKNHFKLSALLPPPDFQFCRMELTRNQWDDLITPIIDRTIELTKKMVDNIYEAKLPLDRVVLIGGSSQLPIVKERLDEILPIEPMRTMDNDVAVANGAAILANTDIIAVRDVYCRMCGKRITSAQKFCTYCGTNNCRYDYRLQKS